MKSYKIKLFLKKKLNSYKIKRLIRLLINFVVHKNLLDKSDIEKLEKLKAEITAGHIEVPDYYKTKK